MMKNGRRPLVLLGAQSTFFGTQAWLTRVGGPIIPPRPPPATSGSHCFLLSIVRLILFALAQRLRLPPGVPSELIQRKEKKGNWVLGLHFRFLESPESSGARKTHFTSISFFFSRVLCTLWTLPILAAGKDRQREYFGAPNNTICTPSLTFLHESIDPQPPIVTGGKIRQEKKEKRDFFLSIQAWPTIKRVRVRETSSICCLRAPLLISWEGTGKEKNELIELEEFKSSLTRMQPFFSLFLVQK